MVGMKDDIAEMKGMLRELLKEKSPHQKKSEQAG